MNGKTICRPITFQQREFTTLPKWRGSYSLGRVNSPIAIPSFPVWKGHCPFRLPASNLNMAVQKLRARRRGLERTQSQFLKSLVTAMMRLPAFVDRERHGKLNGMGFLGTVECQLTWIYSVRLVYVLGDGQPNSCLFVRPSVFERHASSST